MSILQDFKSRVKYTLYNTHGWYIGHCDYMVDVLLVDADIFLGSRNAEQHIIVQLVAKFRPLRDGWEEDHIPNDYSRWLEDREAITLHKARVDYVTLARDTVELNSALLQITNQTRRQVEMATKQGRCAECGETTEQVTLINGVVYCADCRNIDHMLCEVCDTWVADTDMDEMVGVHMCDDCHDKRSQCANCGDIVLIDSAQDVDGDYMCDACIAEHCFKCANCGDYTHNNDGTSVGFDDHVCQDCFEDNYTSCDVCGDSIHRDHTYNTFSGAIICEDCREQHYYVCDDCNDLYHEDTIQHRGDYCYCGSCADENGHSEFIHDYSFRPNPVFHDVGKPAQAVRDVGGDVAKFGVEIEIEGVGCSPHDIAEAVVDYRGNDANYRETFMYCKSDGSLDEGVEIVTHPASLEYHKEIWPDLLDKVRKLGGRSHSTDTCGLHVHFDKNYLNTGEQVKLGIFINFYDDFVSKIARRGRSSWAKYKSKDTPHNQMNINSDRYEALNWQNSNTVEFRMFRGTLNPKTFIASIEFVGACAEFVKKYSTEVITPTPNTQGESWAMFCGFVTNSGYKDLEKMMKKRGVYADTKAIKDATDKADKDIAKKSKAMSRVLAKIGLGEAVAV